MEQTVSRSPRKKGGWKKAIPSVIGGVLIFGIISGLLPKPLEVETAKVQTGPLTVSVLEEGKTRIRHRHVISAPFAGVLKRIPLRAGEQVEAGKTVLAEIESEWTGFLNPRLQAETDSRLKAAQAAKMRSEAGVERARAALDLAIKERTRAESLKNSGSITSKEWDNAEGQAEILAKELRAAEFAKQVSEFEVEQIQATLKQALGTDPKISKPYQILSPVSGFVLNVFEENSKFVAPGVPLLEVGDPQDLETEIELLSSDAVGVKPGAVVSIEQWGGETPLRGRVALVERGGYTKISALGVEEQRVKVRVDFVDPLPADRPLGDRFRVEARIETWNSSNVLQVPTGALFRRGGKWLVFALEGGKARIVPIEIAHNNGVNAEVLSGLTAGQEVVLHAPDALVEGKSVRPR